MVLLHKGVRLLISIHAPREGGDNVISTLAPAVGISIHAPREGGDHRPPRLEFFYVFISIHAPREGGDMGLATTSMAGTLFQSTPPARGAT